jgi:hypothetical protein
VTGPFYQFTNGEKKILAKSHGNATVSNRPFKPSETSTKARLKELVQSKKPKAAVEHLFEEKGGIGNIRSSGEFARDRLQAKHFRRNVKEKELSRSPFTYCVTCTWKKTIASKLKDFGIPGTAATEYMADIFGNRCDPSLQCLVDCKSKEQFNERLISVKEKWFSRHKEGQKFYTFFMQKKAN